jgi:hypothetical protein
MNKPMTLARLICLTTALAAGSALMTVNIANAGENYQRGTSHIKKRNPASDAQRYGLRPQFVISGQPVNVKRVLYHHHHHHHYKEPYELRCHPRCYQPLQAATKGNLTQPTTAGNTVPTASAR